MCQKEKRRDQHSKKNDHIDKEELGQDQDVYRHKYEKLGQAGTMKTVRSQAGCEWQRQRISAIPPRSI